MRRVAGVSGVYGRKTPRVVAQRAVHLGEIRVKRGVWVVVGYGLGAVVGWLVVCLWSRCGVGRVRHPCPFVLVVWGEVFSVGRRVGHVLF